MSYVVTACTSGGHIEEVVLPSRQRLAHHDELANKYRLARRPDVRKAGGDQGVKHDDQRGDSQIGIGTACATTRTAGTDSAHVSKRESARRR